MTDDYRDGLEAEFEGYADEEELPEGPQYEELAEQSTTDPRKVDLPVEGGSRGSVSSNIDNLQDLSDVQTGLLLLNPPDLGGDPIRNKLMIGRNPPESELALIEMYAYDKAMRSDPEETLDFTGLIIEGAVLVGIGRDGMGRIDDLEMIGAARDQKSAENRLREMY